MQLNGLKRSIGPLLLVLWYTTGLWAQAATTITGTVTDDQDTPLIGVNVVVAGTGSGTVTDIDGSYSLSVPEGSETLRFSYLGYESVTEQINNRTTINITLGEDAAQLEEVVVVGYGTQKERNLISAVSTISSEQIEQTPTPSFTNALQGAAAGLQVSSASGEPGAATRILIRGTGSITASAEPLFIVDGIPVASGGTSPLDYLAPTDIASVSVLKDAAATSIYGSRGANGVILITTKTGQQGRPQVTFGVERGFTQPINTLELADANEWRSLVDQARSNSGLTEPYRYEQNVFDQRTIDRYTGLDIYNSTNTDWVDLTTQNGEIGQYTFSASNGTERTSFYVSGQYRNQDGNFGVTNFERYTGRVNLDFDATDFLKVGIRYTYAQQNDQPRNNQQSNVDRQDRNTNFGVWPNFGALYDRALPINPVRWPDDGTYFDILNNRNPNLVASLDPRNSLREIRTQQNLGTAYLQLEPISNLSLRAEVGVDHTDRFDYNYISGTLRVEEYNEEDLANEERELLDYPYETGKPRYRWDDGTFTTFNYNATANYFFTVGADHSVEALLGIEAITSTSDNYEFDLEDVASVQDPTQVRNFVRDESQFLQLSHSGGEDTRFFSQFGRLNYNFREKYLLQASLRRDGSSKFTPEDRFSWFPSLSAGWIMSDEAFLANNSLISFLKVRAGWGTTGNANIGSFLFLDNFWNWPNYPNRAGALTLQRLGSRSIQWEKSNTVDVALDFGLFENRLSGSVGYYYSKTSNLLLSFPVTPSAGIYSTNNLSPTALDNVGSMQNQGVEIELRSININRNRFKWTTDFNFTTNKNKVLELYPGFDGDPRQLSFNGVTTVQEGEPLGMFFLPEFAGYDESGNVLIRAVDQELAGDQIYEFTGENIRNINNEADNNSVIQYGKTGLPTFFGGLTNTFTYRGISLSFQFTFQGGNYVYDDIGLRRVGNGVFNLRQDLVGNTWTPNNPNAAYAALSWADTELNPADGVDAAGSSDRSTQWLRKGDFARLRNINLGYQLPPSLFANNFLKGIRVYANLQNVATFSGFDVVDPEVVNTGDAVSRNLGQGYIGGVPFYQTFTAVFGASLTL